MKLNTTIIALTTITGLLTGSLMAEEGKRERKGPKGGRANKEMLKKFDADGDGKLSDSEKATAKAEAKKRRDAADTNGDGKLSAQERLAAFKKRLAADEKLAARVKARFDADKNGELSDTELTKAASAKKGKRGPKGKSGKGKRPRKNKAEQ